MFKYLEKGRATVKTEKKLKKLRPKPPAQSFPPRVNFEL